MKLLEKIVVDKGEDDDLPPGWKKEVKARKGSGSKTKYDKFYTDPVTGYIFHSLKDVQRYLKTGEVGRLASKPKDNGRVDMVNEDGKVHVSVKMEEREEMSESIQQMSETWKNKRPLEEGSAGCKTRSKSSDTGESESPHHASKRLAGIDIGSPSLPEPKTRQGTQLAAIKTNAPPLPSPSRPEPKTRQATRQSAIKIEDPPSSLPEPKTRQVTRQSAIKIEGAPPSPSLPEPKTRQATLQAGIQIDSPPSSLPDIRSNRQATRQAAIKVYATTPSLPEPKTRQAIQQAGIEIDASIPLPEPNIRQATRQSSINIDAPPPSPSLPEPETRQASRQAGIKIDSLPPSPPDSRKSRQATRPSGFKINTLVPALPPPEPKTSEATQVTRMEDDASPPSSQLEPKTSEATRVTRMEVNASPPLPQLQPKSSKATQVTGTETVASPASPPEPKTRQAKRLTGTRDIASPASLPQPKTRKATRQSGIKIDSPPPSPPDSRTNRQATARRVNLSTPEKNDKIIVAEKITNNYNQNADMDDDIQEIPSIVGPVNQENQKKDEFKTNEKQELRSVIPPKTVDEHFKKIETPLVTFSPHEGQPPPPPTVVPPLNIGKQELPAVNLSSNPIPQPMNFSLSDIWTDPCIEFAVKTLTGAIPFNDLNKVDNFPPSMPMEELWTDPCIEFAVKTLTGAIPLGDTDYLNQQPASSSNLSARHDYSLPDVGRNFCQTEVLSKHFETGHSSKQQDTVASTLGNGNLQKAGNIVNGSNGQFSRSVYFK